MMINTIRTNMIKTKVRMRTRTNKITIKSIEAIITTKTRMMTKSLIIMTRITRREMIPQLQRMI